MNIENIITEFIEHLKNNAEIEYQQTQNFHIYEKEIKKLYSNITELVSPQNKQYITQLLDNLRNIEISYADNLYARGIRDGIKLLKFFESL